MSLKWHWWWRRNQCNKLCNGINYERLCMHKAHHMKGKKWDSMNYEFEDMFILANKNRHAKIQIWINTSQITIRNIKYIYFRYNSSRQVTKLIAMNMNGVTYKFGDKVSTSTCYWQQIDILHCIKSQKGMSWSTKFFCNLDNEHLSVIHMCIKIRDNFLHWTQPTVPNGHRTLCHHIVWFHDNDRLLHHKSWIEDKNQAHGKQLLENRRRLR